MGLVLYAILFLLGARGVTPKSGLRYCLATAAVLLPLSLGAIDDMPPCIGIGCDYSAQTLALVVAMQIILALVSFGAGAAVRRLTRMESGH
jgi:hypothetical protein